jgi:hypothetical protein
MKGIGTALAAGMQHGSEGAQARGVMVGHGTPSVPK